MTDSIVEPSTPEPTTTASAGSDLRGKTTRAALYSTVAQGVGFALRMASTVILARLLAPADFGLVGMVTAFTGFIGLFRDAGLSMATVQRSTITRAEISNLFWINVCVGAALALITVAAGPVLGILYKEPRLLWVTASFAIGFVFNGAAAQHRAILQRDLRFNSIAAIEIISILLTLVISIVAALAGLGYWALVLSNVALPVISAAGYWITGKWIPDWPKRGTDLRSMLHYGGTVTLNALVVYVAYNVEKVLLGRFWGAEALGFYSRAYQLVNLPNEAFNISIGGVAFPALCRVQHDPVRLRNYFLKGYTLFLSAMLPMTAACALFAEDIVKVLLGPQWDASVKVFRLLTPTLLALALINPFAWLMLSTGNALRSLYTSLMIAPVVILGYIVTLKGGPTSVAMGYSIAMMLIVIPLITWAKHGTLIRAVDVIKSVALPGLSTAAAVTGWLLFRWFVPVPDLPLLRLTCASVTFFAIYAVFLLFVMKQKPVYFALLRDLRGGRD